MTTVCTDTVVNATLPSGAILAGREWLVSPLMPWTGDTDTAGRSTYIARNTGKARTVKTWLGVRYGKAPVGPMRWKPAEIYAYPAGTHQCATFDTVSHQSSGNENTGVGRPEWGVDNGAYDWRNMVPGGAKEGEDCLRLAIYAPANATPSSALPVVFWIHGGAWGVNSYAGYPHRGHRLATKGVIVVQVEYRLSSFGFFHHPDFEAEPSWDGPNFAYSDIKSALQWVQTNIAVFGGDPTKVLVGGTSAGASATLALQEDATAAGLFHAAWSCSGGGIGARDELALDSWASGYGPRYAMFAKAAVAASPYMRDYSNPTRTVAQAIAADGEGVGIRKGLNPHHVLAFADGRDRITRASIIADNAAYTFEGTENVYPFKGNGLTYRTNITAADAGEFAVPIVISATENEASVSPGYVSWSDQTASNFIRRLNVFSFDEWQALSWINAGWDATDRRRYIYNHSTFQFPAWRIARAIYTTASTTAYLTLWNFSGTSTANHSADVHYLFGNLEWNVGMSGGEAAVTVRMLEMAEGMMQLFVNMAANANPNTAYSYPSQDFDLFDTPPALALVAASGANQYHWNICGHSTALAANTAPVQTVHQSYFGGAWADYLATYG